VGHFTEVKEEYFVGDSFSERDGQVKTTLLEAARGEDRLHGDNLWILVGHFNTDSPFAGHGSDDTYTECFEAESDVIFEVTYFGDPDTGFGYHFVEGDGGADGSLYGGDTDPEVEKSLFDVILVGVLFIHVHLTVIVVIVFEEVEVGVTEEREVKGGVIFSEFVER
jgi:hypothetical protein